MKKNLRFFVDPYEYLVFQKVKNYISDKHGFNVDSSTVFVLLLDFYILKHDLFLEEKKDGKEDKEDV